MKTAKLLAVSSGKEISMLPENDLNTVVKKIPSKINLDNLFFSPDNKTLFGIGHQLLANEIIKYTQFQWNAEDGKLIKETVLDSK